MITREDKFLENNSFRQYIYISKAKNTLDFFIFNTFISKMQKKSKLMYMRQSNSHNM